MQDGLPSAHGDAQHLRRAHARAHFTLFFSGPGYVGGDSATPGVKSAEVRDIVNISAATQRWLRVKVTH